MAEAPNLLEGQAPLLLGDQSHVVAITMRRAGALREEFGDDWGKTVFEAIRGWDGEARKIAVALEIVTGGTVEAEAFLDMHPPPTQVSILEAWMVAHAVFWQGPPGMQTVEAELAKEASEEDPLPSSTGWSSSGPRLVRRVWRRARFGLRRPGSWANGSATEPLARVDG